MFISCSSAAQGDTLHTHLWHEQKDVCICVCVSQRRRESKTAKHNEKLRERERERGEGCVELTDQWMKNWPLCACDPTALIIFLFRCSEFVLWGSDIHLLFHALSNKTKQLSLNSLPKIHSPTQTDSPEDGCVNTVSLCLTPTHTQTRTQAQVCTLNNTNHWPLSRQAYRHTAFLFSPSCSSRPYCIIL